MYQIYGGPGSPYSHKIRAVFRYRRIPHTWQVPRGGFAGGGALGGRAANTPLQEARKNVVPVVRYPDGAYKADSTPIMVELEKLHAERSIVPPNPGIAFLAHLIEDMADEYLPIPMFYFRWTDDAEWCARRQMVGWSGGIDDKSLDAIANAFLARQRGQLGARAAMPREQVLDNYGRFLAAMETQLKRAFFLFGTRPSFAEFGLYGQLSQYIVDPTVSGIMKRDAVRVFQWTHFLDDMSGVEGEWAEARSCLTEELEGLIAAIAPGYFGMARGLQQSVGMEDLATSVNGAKYRVKCYLALKAELDALDDKERVLIRPILEASGCWEPLQFREGERDKVVPIVPA